MKQLYNKKERCDRISLCKIIDQKERILNKLREKGLRITNQRKLIIDIILDKECSCCKEIYFQAHNKDHSLGIATVYRMVKILEEIGVIDRRNLYRMGCNDIKNIQDGCMVILENKDIIALSVSDWSDILELGLKARGFITEYKVEAIMMN